MRNLDRREFLKRIALLSGVAAGADLLYQGSWLAGGTKAQISRADSIFVQGVISAVNADNLEVEAITEETTQTLTIYISDATYLWKGEATTLQEVEPGDFVYCRGLPLIEGGLIAVKLWVNIANVYGRIQEIKDNTLQLQVFRHGAHPTDKIATVRLDNKTLVNEQKGRSTSTFNNGQYIQVVGVVQRDKSLKAVRVFFSEET